MNEQPRRAHASIVPGPYRLIHGGDYNPDQWLHRPEILDTDAPLMVQAGVNQASVGIFAWSTLEPADGVFDFEWLDRTFERLHAHGVGIILATPSAARPRWLAEAHPDVMRTTREGRRLAPGMTRHNHCLTAPALRERLVRINAALAQRYSTHPALLGWHIGNEFGGDEDGARCYCERCIAGFQAWLRRRYADDLGRLNRSWWASFWSHTYSDWSQIRPGDISIEALNLNWNRYQSGLVADFCAMEIEAVRRHSSAAVTTNMHGDLTHYDHGEVARHLDLTTYDGYPDIDGSPKDAEQLHRQCWYADAIRTFRRGQPWLLMESCPSQPQYKPVLRLKRPGVHRSLSLAMVAHGSDGVCYFQWRAGRGGMEKLHGAVIMQDAPADTRVFREVAGLGHDLQSLNGVAGAATPSPVAVLWDVESEWARGWNSGLYTVPRPGELSQAWHRPLWHAGIGCDVPDASASLDGYQVIVVPGMFLLRPGFAERLQSAAERGAQVVIDGLSAWVDDDFSCVAGGRPGPLGKALGIRCEELDQLRQDERIRVVDPEGWLPDQSLVSGWIDHVLPTDATVIVQAADGFHDGWPVLTRKQCGQGAFWYAAANLDEAAKAHFLRRLTDELGIIPPLRNLPPGVSLRERVQPDRRFVFLCNTGQTPANIQLDDRPWTDAVSGAPLGRSLTLAPWQTSVMSLPA